MKDTLIEAMRLSAISPLSGRASRFLFRHQVLGKYPAEYFYDDTIGYIFVREPHWLDEAYTESISALDTGILARNLGNINLIRRCLANHSRHRVTKGIDLGAGYGIFVRGMRDIGIDFYWSDKYSQNLLARGFEAKPGDYSVAVAFEVLEHLPNPVEFLRDACSEFRFQTCFFSAACFDEENLPGADWWYWVFESGQHISFFSRRALQWMAEQLEMRLWHITGEVFAFSNLEWKPLVESSPSMLWSRICSRLGRMLPPQRTASCEPLTWNDHLMLRDKLRNELSKD